MYLYYILFYVIICVFYFINARYPHDFLIKKKLNTLYYTQECMNYTTLTTKK
jgi:hypothetical protein